MEKRLLFEDIPSKRKPRLRVRFVIYDNVGQRTLLAITVDQLKCTPRSRYPDHYYDAKSIYFLARNISLGYRVSSS